MPRVLVCGGHVRDNKFVRNVEELGCIVDWHDARAGKAFPKFADAAVIAKFQCSHQAQWDVKDAYIKQGKPVFVADHSFLTIKERFGIFLDGWVLKNSKKQTVMGDAMSKAIEQVKPAPTPHANAQLSDKKVGIDRMRLQYKPEVRQRLRDTLIAHYNAGMRPEEAAVQMAKLGLTLTDGRPIKPSHVSVWRGKHGLIGKRSGKREEPQSAATTVTASKPAPAPKVASKGPDKVVYELILSANLPPVETTALMRRCMDGKLTQDECLKFIELYTDLKGG